MKKKTVFIGILVIFVVIIHLYSAIFVDTKINHVKLDYPIEKKYQNLNGYKILFFSDSHHIGIDWLKEALLTYQDEDIDLLVLGGDYSGSHLQDKKMIEMINDLPVGKKKAMVLGNHDPIEVESVIKEYPNVIYLKNSGFQDRKNLYVAGTEDLWTGKADIKKATEKANKDDFILLVAHNPDTVMKQSSEDINLVLSGHTHGGGANLFGVIKPSLLFVTDYPHKFGGGMSYNDDGSAILVTKGVGSQKFRPRVFAQPEIVEVELKVEKSTE